MTGTKFRWQGPPGQKCELFGDVLDWTRPVPMPEVTPGTYECALRLAPGVYRYKFRLNRNRWVADATAATDPTEGFDNSVAIVGGSEPPLFFAPDRGHVAVYEDGTVVIHVENDGQQPPLVSIDGIGLDEEYLGERHARRRAIFRGTVACDAGLSPELRVGAYRTPLPRPRSILGQPPAWAKRAVFYAIFVDRWHRGAASPPDERASPRNAPSMAATFYGGDLWGIAEGLDYLCELGVDAIVLTPIQTAPSPHRYDGIDLFEIDPRLGGKRAFEHLLIEAHRRGLKVVADAPLTHVHEDHPAFQSVLSEQQASPYCDWFYIRRYPVRARDPECVDLYPTKRHLPWLNLNSPRAREYVIEAASRLIRRGADGLRLDAMTRAPSDFWSGFRRRVRSENPEALLLGEIVTDRPACFAEELGVDLATDFAHREAILDFFRRQTISASELIDRLEFHNFRVGPFEPSFRLLFLDNHDTDRFLLPDTHFSVLRLALTYLLLRPEPVGFNYGTEMALRQAEVGLRDEAIPERMPMPPLALGVNRTQRLVQDLLALRHRERALQGPTVTWIHAVDRVLVFDRSAGASRIRVAINAGRDRVNLGLVLPSSAERLLQIDDGIIEEPATLAPLSAVVARMSTC
jgi:cyclomaltodextrinase